MTDFPEDIYTEPADLDVDTLANLGPLRRHRGGLGRHQGTGRQAGRRRPGQAGLPVERYELQPIDPQTNGPQIYYGLRYHTHIVKPGEVETYHDQVGYWLWEPATGTVMHSLTIPRGQVVLAGGEAKADAVEFEVFAKRGETVYGICSAPFLEHAFRTDAFRMRVSINADGTWSYFEETTLVIRGRDVPFAHTDRNTLKKIAEPTPNPLMRGAAG